MAGKIHNGPNGPAPCGATPGKGRGCPYDKEGTGANHYDTQEEAQAAFDAKMESEHGATATVSKKVNNSYPVSVSKLVSAIDRGNMSEITELGKNEEIVKIPHEDWKQLETIATSEYEKMKAEDGGQLKREQAAFNATWAAAKGIEDHGTPENIRKAADEAYARAVQNPARIPAGAITPEERLKRQYEAADQAKEMIDNDPNGDPLATRRALSESHIKRSQAMARAGLKVKIAKTGAELTDPNREIAGVKVPVGYDKHKAAYALDGKLLGLDNSNSVAGPQFKHNGDVIKVRPSTSKDPDERVKRNAAKGFKLGYLLTPTSIDVTGEKAPVTQIQRVKMNNIPLPGAGERTK